MLKHKHIVVLSLVAALVLTVVIWFVRPSAQPYNPAPPTPTTSPVAIVNVGTSSLPQSFPSDFPSEAGATITQNYNTTNPAGQPIAVREFVSKKTMAANFTLYKNYLTTGKWTINFSLDAADQKILDATKGASRLRIRIYTNNTQQIVVSAQVISQG